MADISNVEVVFVKPVRFEDCVNVARYIKEDKIVNMNLSQLDDKDSRRVLYYISGAIFITRAEIVNVGNKVFLNETQKERRGSSTEEEEEEIVPVKRR